MKIIAMYLPQYHRVKENDLWWGDGYTDWTAVKSAESLFEGHIQPRIPLNRYYYDLSQKETMRWQAELLNKYGVDGICMYHYWFKDGKRVLEQPAENLLKWKDIKMPFCFSWANEKWARSWAKIPASNAWAKKFEKGELNNELEGVLLAQDYGDEYVWVEHFNYLLPFFKDDRYIKIDNKPIFHFFLTHDIKCLDKMILTWRKLAAENGIGDIYFIGSDALEWQKVFLDALLISEPNEATSKLSFLKINGDSKRFSYDQLWSQILLDSYSGPYKTYYQGITGLDETPRQGEKAYLVEHASPNKFYCYLKEILYKSNQDGNDVLFLNAWNEWGEGMYLEPDEKYQFGYLEAVSRAKKEFALATKKTVPKDLTTALHHHLEILCHKMDENVKLLSKWLKASQNSNSLGTWLKETGVSHVAIYGMGVMGNHLYRELKKNGIVIDYIIDKKDKQDLQNEYKVLAFHVEDFLPDTELIVVAVSVEADGIVEILRKRNFKSISINELLDLYVRGICSIVQ